jgi:hypothetical protein
MEYKIQTKIIQADPNTKYKIIVITDIALHTGIKRQSSVGYKVQKAFENNSPDRVYFPMNLSNYSRERLSIPYLLDKDEKFKEFVLNQQMQGYKVCVELEHITNIPVRLGKDTIEFLNSINGKRLLRGLEKNK